MNIEATAKQIMSAMQSDAFNEEACRQILRDNLSGGEGLYVKCCECKQFTLRYSSTIDGLRCQGCGVTYVNSKHRERNAAQPKPESWRDIAEEYALFIVRSNPTWWGSIPPSDCIKSLKSIILTVIERSHAAQPQPGKASPLGERRDAIPSAKIAPTPPLVTTLPVVSYHPPAKATDWTPERVKDYLKWNDGVDILAMDFTAELAAERRRREQAEHWLGELLAVIHCDGGHYQSEHGTEKATKDAIDKRNRLVARNDILEYQLLSALAAIEKHNNTLRRPTPQRINIDLSALREHDAELRAQWEKEHEQSK
jgi:ribosomal protein S27E